MRRRDARERAQHIERATTLGTEWDERIVQTYRNLGSAIATARHFGLQFDTVLAVVDDERRRQARREAA